MTARGYVSATPPLLVGHTTPRHRKSWWESALDTAGDVGAAVYNGTVVPLVNGAADLGQAMVEHPADVAGLLLGGGMILLGGSGEVGGVALDATGVGAVVGVPINIAAAGLIAAGAGIVATSAGTWAATPRRTTTTSSTRPRVRRPRDPSRATRCPSRLAKGEVWQKPENINAPLGTPANANSVRIMEPNAHPNGYVRFYNEHGQPVTAEGKPGGRTDPATHIPIQPDGTLRRPPRMEPVIPDFAGKVIILAKIDYGLHLWTADSWEIVLAGPVLVSGTGTAPKEIEVDAAESPLPPQLADVVGGTIAQLLVAEGGHLGVQLGDRQLSVRADDRYEAWQIAGPDGELLVCTPGGELVHFPPVRRDNTPSA